MEKTSYSFKKHRIAEHRKLSHGAPRNAFRYRNKLSFLCSVLLAAHDIYIKYLCQCLLPGKTFRQRKGFVMHALTSSLMLVLCMPYVLCLLHYRIDRVIQLYIRARSRASGAHAP